MSLKEELHEAITGGLQEAYPMHPEESFAEVGTLIFERVWTTLEDELGATQERLLLQVNAAHAEVAALRRKTDALQEMLREAMDKVEVEDEG